MRLWTRVRPLVCFASALACAAAPAWSGTILPDPEVLSAASISGDASSVVCGVYSTGNFGTVCNFNAVAGPTLQGEDTSTGSGGTASVSGAAETLVFQFGTTPVTVLGSGSASAAARTRAWENRARASASDAVPTIGNAEPDNVAGFTASERLFDYGVSASASSLWTDHLTFQGGLLGNNALLRFALEGSAHVSQNGPSPNPEPGRMSFEFMLFDPDVSLDPNDGLFQAYGSLVFTGEGSFDETLDVVIPFVPGKTYLAMGLLTVEASAGGANDVQCDANGNHCVVGRQGSYASADYDFFDTVAVSSLFVPEGVTALGFGGAALPFSVVTVPEPSGAALLLLGLGALAGRRRPRRGA